MQCRICGSSAEHKTYQVREMMLGLQDEHTYFQCSQCQCLQIAVIPDNLQDYYPQNYYSYQAPARGNRLRRALVRLRDYYAVTGESQPGHLLNLLMPNPKLATLRPLNLKPDSTVLDVGCGAGLILYSLRELGFTKLLGIDPFNQDGFSGSATLAELRFMRERLPV